MLPETVGQSELFKCLRDIMFRNMRLRSCLIRTIGGRRLSICSAKGRRITGKQGWRMDSFRKEILKQTRSVKSIRSEDGTAEVFSKLSHPPNP